MTTAAVRASSSACTTAEEEVWAALGTVRDPELDEAITQLDFVERADVDGEEVSVRLRLPTYFCAPNFAYLMVADAHDAVAALDWVTRVRVELVDHFAAEEVNAGVAGGRGFAGSFPGLADAELEELRVTFQRKAHRAAQEALVMAVVAGGWPPRELTHARIRDAPAGAALERLLRRRRDLGLPADREAPLLVDDEGEPLEEVGLEQQLRLARTTRVSIEGNAHLCRGLLAVRYGLPQAGT